MKSMLKIQNVYTCTCTCTCTCTNLHVHVHVVEFLNAILPTCASTFYFCTPHPHSKRGSLPEAVLVNELNRPGVVEEREGKDLTQASKTPESPKVQYNCLFKECTATVRRYVYNCTSCITIVGLTCTDSNKRCIFLCVCSG